MAPNHQDMINRWRLFCTFKFAFIFGAVKESQWWHVLFLVSRLQVWPVNQSVPEESWFSRYITSVFIFPPSHLLTKHKMMDADISVLVISQWTAILSGSFSHSKYCIKYTRWLFNGEEQTNDITLNHGVWWGKWSTMILPTTDKSSAWTWASFLVAIYVKRSSHTLTFSAFRANLL